MVKDTLAGTVARFDTYNQPVKLSNALKKQQEREFEDCAPCRIMGAGAFAGLGVYTYFSGHSQLREQEHIIKNMKTLFGMGARRAGINGIAATLVGLGLYRFFA